MSRSQCSSLLVACAWCFRAHKPLVTDNCATMCPWERSCPIPDIIKGTYVPSLFTQNWHTQKCITELLDKSPGAELFGSWCAQSLVWHSPAALPSALPARLRALSGQKNTERMYMSVPMCRELWVDCSSAVWEMETTVTCGSNQNYLRSVGSSLLYHWVIVSFAFSFSGYFILPE